MAYEPLALAILLDIHLVINMKHWNTTIILKHHQPVLVIVAYKSLCTTVLSLTNSPLLTSWRGFGWLML